MEFLNQYSGLFSLLAVLATIIVPIVIFKKQRKHDEAAEKRSIERERDAERRRKEKEQYAKREKERREQQDAQDALETIENLGRIPMSLEEKRYYADQIILQKRLSRK